MPTVCPQSMRLRLLQEVLAASFYQWLRFSGLLIFLGIEGGRVRPSAPDVKLLLVARTVSFWTGCQLAGT